MEQILARIKRAYHLGTDAEVANFLDIKPSTLSMQKNRGRLNLERILEKCCDLNKNWLFDGEGAMRNKGIPIYTSLDFTGGDFNPKESKQTGSVSLDVNEELWAYSSTKGTIGYILSGNSMYPTLQKDDLAIIDIKQNTPEDGAIFLMSFNGNAMCRRIQKNPSEKFLVSADNSDESFEIAEEENDHRIIGKIVSVLREI